MGFWSYYNASTYAGRTRIEVAKFAFYVFLPIVGMYICGLPATFRYMKEHHGLKVPAEAYERRLPEDAKSYFQALYQMEHGKQQHRDDSCENGEKCNTDK